VLVPYPYAWRYQKVNADVLVQHGAAIMLEDGKLTDQLLPAVNNLLNQPQKLASMRIAMKQLSRPDAATEIGHQILALCQERSLDHG
jgi:UDP-N-acetylglucosamine:LPS N-acetylglucosamine transferase